MLHRVDALRRWFGTLFLVLAGGMLIWGMTVLEPYLRGRWFVVYWLVCFFFTALAMATALMDIRSMRKNLRQERRQLLEKTIAQIRGRNDERNNSKPPNANA